MSFSERYGYREPLAERELIREDAPEGVRVGILAIFEEALKPARLRDVVCKVLRKRPEPSNWSEYPNIWIEVQELVHAAPWYQVYDIVEAAIAATRSDERTAVTAEVNKLFVEESLAWHVVKGKVVLRTGDVGDDIMERAVEDLEEVGRPAAARELAEAMKSLSRRPNPDTRDAVRRAANAMEAVARDVTGNRTATLADILKKRGDILPPALDAGFSKVWGFANDFARHVDERKEPTVDEAVLVVGIFGAAVAYLARH